TYWIIAIAVIAIFHEFAHGIIARLYNVKILTTGFGFLGPFLAAFVEPDEKQMEEKPKYQQLAILSAGVFTNLVLAILFFLLLSVFFVAAYVPAGAMFNTYTPGAVNINTIESIGGKNLEDVSREGILNLIDENNIDDDFVLGSNGNAINLTKVVANGEVYYITVEKLELQLEIDDEEVGLYKDLPAINSGLRGSIIRINEFSIRDHDELAEVMNNFKPGDVVNIVTKDVSKGEEEILEYGLVLGDDDGRGVIGIGFVGGAERTLGKITDFFNFFKKPATNYEPRFNVDLIVFIYNLIWWLALINLSVALVNMWPVAIFDGGRFFYLTIWGITGSEAMGRWAFKGATYAILFVLFLLMAGWFVAIF
ncbi:hypothetical protein CMI42_03590, partial [Candidatus Pacearchaeota archaeon]|nr:hypothetical protein [Candidatus Pacearchaeota archaeon]